MTATKKPAKRRKTITTKDLWDLAEGTFYCDKREDLEEGEEMEHWEPFEYHSADQVEGFVSDLAYSIESFLKSKGITVKDNL